MTAESTNLTVTTTAAGARTIGSVRRAVENLAAQGRAAMAAGTLTVVGTPGERVVARPRSRAARAAAARVTAAAAAGVTAEGVAGITESDPT